MACEFLRNVIVRLIASKAERPQCSRFTERRVFQSKAGGAIQKCVSGVRAKSPEPIGSVGPKTRKGLHWEILVAFPSVAVVYCRKVGSDVVATYSAWKVPRLKEQICTCMKDKLPILQTLSA